MPTEPAETTTDSPIFGRVTIVGVGLIGGSIALRLHEMRAAREVVGVDLAANLEKIRPLVDTATDDLAFGVTGSELVILATPIPVTLDLLPKIAATNRDCAITDTCSTKVQIFNAGEAAVPNRFVAGHPLAGGERGGADNARADLFVNATWAVCAYETPARQRVLRLVEIMGATSVVITPSLHDATVAVTSHLPHLLAYALAAQGAEAAAHENLPVAQLAAGGWHSMTRTAASDSRLWTEISASNRTHLSAALHEYRLRLADLQDALDNGATDNDARLYELLTEGHAVKWKLER